MISCTRTFTTDVSEVGLGFTQAQTYPYCRIAFENYSLLFCLSQDYNSQNSLPYNARARWHHICDSINAIQHSVINISHCIRTIKLSYGFFNTKHINPMLFRWIDLLMSLEFTVIHWPGASNRYADAMSRPPIENNYNLIEEHNHTVQCNVISTNAIVHHLKPLINQYGKLNLKD